MNKACSIGDIVTLLVKRVGINAEGIAYLNNTTVFIKGCTPGEEVKVEITKIHETYIEAKLLDIISVSADRRTPFCEIYDLCGGCSLQHVSYEKMLDSKKDILIRAIGRYAGGLPLDIFQSPLKAKKALKYRTKVTLPLYFINEENRFGIYDQKNQKMSFLNDCIMHSTNINAILKKLEILFNQFKLSGFLYENSNFDIDSVTIKENSFNKLVVLFNLNQVNEIIMQKIKHLIDVLVSDTSEKIQAILYKKAHAQPTLIYGNEYICEEINGITLRIKSDIFIETLAKHNNEYYEILAKTINENNYSNLLSINDELGYSLVFLRDNLSKGYYYEEDLPLYNEGIRLLKSYDNITALDDFPKSNELVYVEASRIGLGQKKLEFLMEKNVEAILYGSCNPSSLGKDLKILKEKFFIEKIYSLDVYPYTSIVESITYLKAKKK